MNNTSNDSTAEIIGSLSIPIACVIFIYLVYRLDRYISPKRYTKEVGEIAEVEEIIVDV